VDALRRLDESRTGDSTATAGEDISCVRTGLVWGEKYVTFRTGRAQSQRRQVASSGCMSHEETRN
jgi:hypothetical protein